MIPILTVRGLCKRYSAFQLENVSFSLAPGHIVGFIGRNGAGKSTTLHSLLGLVHPDAGEVCFFSRPYAKNERDIRQRIGFVSSGMQYYPKKRLAAVTAVTRGFYERWDEAYYRHLLGEFALDERKTFSQLSNGMQIKYALALALSHGADLLLLDEPTSGLDPVSREELLLLFRSLRAKGKTILFSTHITGDLDKCADDVLYLRRGRLCGDAPLHDFIAAQGVDTLDEAMLRLEREVTA